MLNPLFLFKVAINRTDYFQNLLNLNQFEKADWTRRLTTGEDRTQWPYKSYDTTMTFFNTWNELLIPAGMMQFPVYEWTLPHYFNFGTMGGLVGHYLVHAIDSWGKCLLFAPGMMLQSQYKSDFEAIHIGLKLYYRVKCFIFVLFPRS